jgi:DNA-binding transcriptional regulator YhcF (GntR family)
MEWKFNDESPLYLQIMEQIKTWIASGQLKANEKMMSVRDLAMEAGVNPNTMQKALSELEREGLLYSQRTSGRFVADIKDTAAQLKSSLAAQHMTDYLSSMEKIGYDSSQSVEELMKFTDYNGEKGKSDRKE